jgi:hypothetical protein
VTITRIGATKKYASNWAQAFGKKDADRKTAAKTPKLPKKKTSPASKKTTGKESA